MLLFLLLKLQLIGLVCAISLVADSSHGTIDFAGIGAISGGGATSRLLVSYPEPQRSEILDLLFKPQFAASLQILKVEVGGDAQSTDGSEPSHRHTADEEPNFQRGYEWWLMKEAKARNPDIRLWALPWAFPGWLDPTGSSNPYSMPTATAAYTAEWVAAARDHHGLHIDMIGCWNERAWDATYLKELRAALDKSSLQNTSIVAPDGSLTSTASLAEAMARDHDLFQAVDVIGAHYPGAKFDQASKKVAADGAKLLFASEDYGVYFDASGAKAWARLLNQNFVSGGMSGTIAWNLVSAYYAPYQTAYYGPEKLLPGPVPYQSLPYRLCGLMHAAWPWAGHYAATAQLYVTAHHTHFTKPGWQYLPAGSGSGLLDLGGSAVTLMSPDGRDFTVVIEKMSWPGSQSAWQGLPEYTTAPENVTVRLPLQAGVKMAIWKSFLPAGGAAAGEDASYLDHVFVRQPDLTLTQEGQIQLEVCKDCLFTITTRVDDGHKGQFAPSPPSAPFPLPYRDDFDKTPLGLEPDYFADQGGSFEIVFNADRGGNRSLRQMVMETPCSWAGEKVPLSIIGDSNWTDTFTSIDVMLEDHGIVWLGSRLKAGNDPRPPAPNPPPIGLKSWEGDAANNLHLINSTGVFLSLNTKTQQWRLSFYALGEPIFQGPLPFELLPGEWHRLQLEVQGDFAWGSLDGIELFDNRDVSMCKNSRGFVAIGTGGFYAVQFDDLNIQAPSQPAILSV